VDESGDGEGLAGRIFLDIFWRHNGGNFARERGPPVDEGLLISRCSFLHQAYDT